MSAMQQHTDAGSTDPGRPVAAAMQQMARATAALGRRTSEVNDTVARWLRDQPPVPARKPVSTSRTRNASKVGLRVLVAENDRDFCESISRGLREEGYEVREAHSAAEARMAAAAGFDAILVDIDLGDALGMGVVEAARAARPDVAVVLMSGVLSRNRNELAASLGARDVIPKPFSLDRMLTAIDSALEDISKP